MGALLQRSLDSGEVIDLQYQYVIYIHDLVNSLRPFPLRTANFHGEVGVNTGWDAIASSLD
ncbi:MAG: hypothetical protein EA367_20445 [Leptolyngbya sp. DLM2.Bin15]|nr:MAG: hypothetical protein EA367_20445 [Leptolyngbya sp. DLM2.Bin15]